MISCAVLLCARVYIYVYTYIHVYILFSSRSPVARAWKVENMSPGRILCALPFAACGKPGEGKRRRGKKKVDENPNPPCAAVTALPYDLRVPPSPPWRAILSGIRVLNRWSFFDRPYSPSLFRPLFPVPSRPFTPQLAHSVRNEDEYACEGESEKGEENERKAGEMERARGERETEINTGKRDGSDGEREREKKYGRGLRCNYQASICSLFRRTATASAAAGRSVATTRTRRARRTTSAYTAAACWAGRGCAPGRIPKTS